MAGLGLPRAPAPLFRERPGHTRGLVPFSGAWLGVLKNKHSTQTQLASGGRRAAGGGRGIARADSERAAGGKQREAPPTRGSKFVTVGVG
jgi:hypothetical protein